MNAPVPFALGIASQAPGSLRVIEFRAVERLGGPTSIRVRVESIDLAPDDAETLLGAAAALTIEGSDGARRRFGGVVRRVVYAGYAVEGRHVYSLDVVSRDHLLRHRRTTRIFQEKSVPEIVVEVLSKAHVPVAVALQRTYAKRLYCVQYQEDDLRFVSRLLADEGIFSFVRDPRGGADETETIVLADTVDALDKVPEPLRFRPRSGFASSGEFAESVKARSAMRPGGELVRSFDFRKPHVTLSSEARAPVARGEDALFTYEHRYDLKQDAFDAASADKALEQRRSLRALLEIESNSVRVAPGLRFRLEGHPSFGEWLTTVAVEHHGWTPDAEPGRGGPRRADGEASVVGGTGYWSRATCALADVEVRPRRKKRRLQQVMETATVVGPVGEEIHTDAYGRVKVQFHWDLEGQSDENSSCWIRAMQPWAGSAFGFQFIPRVGMEVVVSFSGGDADRPVVLGCLYNGTNPMPNLVPADARRSGLRTRSSPAGAGRHELMFDDTAGGESVELRAERDLNVEATRDHDRRIARDERLAVGRNAEHTIGGDHVRSVAGNEIVTIEKNLVMHVMGTQSIRVDGGASKGGPGSRAAGRPHPTPSASAADAAPPLAAGAGVLDGGPAPSISPSEAELAWRVSQLPAELEAAGDQVERAIARRAEDVARLREELAGLSRRARRLLLLAGTPAPRRANQPAAFAALRDIDRLRSRLDGAGRTITVAPSGWPAADDERFAGVRAAAEKRLGGLGEDVGAMRTEAEGHDYALRAGYGLPSRTRDATAAPGIAGSARGGGGADLPDRVSTDDSDISYAGPPDKDNEGERETKTAPISTRIDIDGAGEIDACDGFKISAGGCEIEMFEGVITLTATTIILSGDDVQVSGSTVAVTGEPITLN